MTLRWSGDLSGAQAFHEQVLAARIRVIGKEHPATLVSMSNLAETLRVQGDRTGCARFRSRCFLFADTCWGRNTRLR